MWRELCSELDMANEPRHFMRLLKAEKTEAFACIYHNLCKKCKKMDLRLHTNKCLRCTHHHRDEAKRTQTYITGNDSSPDKQPFSILELNAALTLLPTHRACGSDGIYNEFLKHASPLAKTLLFYLFNAIFHTGHVPLLFHRLMIIPVMKPNRDASKLENNCPIALTSCFGKLLE